MVRLRPHLARAGALTALIGPTAPGLAGQAAADPANAPADVQTLMSHLSAASPPPTVTPAAGAPAAAR